MAAAESSRAASAASGAEPWTTRRLLDWMVQRFSASGLDAPRVVAELLLAHALGCERVRLYMEVDRPAAPEELARLRELVRRADAHEPVHYLVGRARFFGREFLVDSSTQIPQPCTEELVAHVLGWCREAGPRESGPLGEGRPGPVGPDAAITDAPLRIADIGTGTGCIAITLALQLTRAQVIATDIAPECLELAARNADRLGAASRIAFRLGSLLQPLVDAAADAPLDVICSNPPYIPDEEWNGGRVQPAVRDYVNPRALRGGADGLDLIRPLIAGAGSLLRPGGLLALEIADAHRDAVLDLVRATSDLEHPRVHRDADGLSRVLLAAARG